MERKEAIEIIKKNWPDSSFTILREALETVIPELSETEYEKIRKALIDYFRWNPDGQLLDEFSNREVLAWLEKQGEHAKFWDSIQVGDKVTRNQDGVLVNLSRLKRVAKRDEKQGEQKPAEDRYMEGYLNGINDTLKSTVWSEEDEKMLSDIIKDLVHPWNEYIPDRIENEIRWLKNRLKSSKYMVQPQAKQEWSEEDRETIDYLIDYLESELDSSYTKEDKEEFTKEIELLKSLRPKNRWKPTKRQLLELRCVISGCSFDTPVLVELEENLKKLIEE